MFHQYDETAQQLKSHMRYLRVIHPSARGLPLNGAPVQSALTHQYGVPMKESLLCKVLLFFADTPKSAASMKRQK